MTRAELRDMRLRAMRGEQLREHEQLALVEACERLVEATAVDPKDPPQLGHARNHRARGHQHRPGDQAFMNAEEKTLAAYGDDPQFVPSAPPEDEIPPAFLSEEERRAKAARAPDAAPATERPQGAKLITGALIDPSPSNPRKTFRDLEELAETIKKHGILQPLVVRPKAGRLELVFGERRLRAGKLAGLTAFPCLVREMSDLEVLEVQIIENVQRADVDALEEADGYKVLHETHGYSVPDIAAKIGKSIAYVYARLKLCALGPEGRKALAEGKLTDSTALLVARIPLPLQGEAVKELEPDFDHGGDEDADPKEKQELDPLGAREAFVRIKRRFMLRLADAPFDPKDVELVPKAGACTTCPKRTGAQPELFPDVKAADTCTDPTCFDEKRDASWERRKKQAKAEGIDVVEGKKAKEYFPYGSNLSRSSGMVDLDEKDWSDPKRRTTRERVKKEDFEKQLAGRVTLVRTEDGAVHELVPAKEVKKLLPKPKTADERARDAEPKKSPAESRNREAEIAGHRAGLALIVKKFETKEPDKLLWRLLVEREIDCAVCDVNEVLERRGLVECSKSAQDAYLAKIDVAALRGLFIELGLSDDAAYPHEKSPLARVASALKIDLKQLVAKELARLKTEEKAPKNESIPAKEIAAAGKAAKKKAAKKAAKSKR